MRAKVSEPTKGSFMILNAKALNGASSAGGRVSWVSPSSFRSEEHTSELQSLMRISYAVFCLKKKKKPDNRNEEKTCKLQRPKLTTHEDKLQQQKRHHKITQPHYNTT